MLSTHAICQENVEPWLAEVGGWQRSIQVLLHAPLPCDQQYLWTAAQGVLVQSVTMELGQKTDSEKQ
jgi:hypothetical protein